MSIDDTQLLALPVAEKLRIVELLWDDIGSSDEPLPLPAWIDAEANRRREEMRSNPQASLTHEEVWRRIDGRRG